MASGDVIRLVNVGDVDFVGGYNGHEYTVKAHSQLMVDWNAMCLWLGHPDANDFDPRNRVRVQEFARLRGRYGVDARSLEMSTEKIPFDPDELFQSMRPTLEAYGMDDERIYTVADDPNGDFLAPKVAAGVDSGDMSVMQARMQVLEQEQSNLRQQLAKAQRREAALDDAQPIDPDAPRTPSQNQGIPGTVIEEPGEFSTTAPRAPAVSEPTEDIPSRIRVTQP